MDTTTDVAAAARALLALIASEGGSPLPEDLTEVEQRVREAALRVGAKAAELHLAGRALGYEGSSRACPTPGCGGDQRFVGHRPRTLATLLGQVTVRRAYYHCPQCGSSGCPYDAACGLGPKHESVGLAKAAALVAVMDPFAPAADVLEELTGQRLSDRTVHRVTRRAGAVASERERQGALRMAAWSVPVGGVEARPARLYVAVDGVMVHRAQWNEAKCVTCYWEADDGRGGVRREARYAVRFESAEHFAAFVWSLACRCGLESAAEVILLGDGAAWIWERVWHVLGERAVRITDWYHVMEHVWACGRALHGEGTAAAEAWVKGRETMLWEGRYARLLDALADERQRTRSPPKRRALGELATYLANQGERLAYDRFRAAGYDIGSGRVESACKHVVGVRMKRSGMIWSDDGAQDVLSLRVVRLNGEWDRFWATKPLMARAA
jgi:Uncharacterised protein family (UPF0236)